VAPGAHIVSDLQIELSPEGERRLLLLRLLFLLTGKGMLYRYLCVASVSRG
jgi:hypothetical protein